MSAATDAFVRQNQSRLLEELIEFLRIPSISTLPENRPDIDRAARFVADRLRQAGMENVETIATDKASAGLRGLAARAGEADGALLRTL